MREVSAKAIEPIIATIGEFVAYEGVLEIHFLDEVPGSKQHVYQTLYLSIPMRPGIAPSFPRADAHWNEIAGGICDAIGKITLYKGRILARFVDEHCEHPECTHGPVDFVMEFFVIPDKDDHTPPPLLAAGMQAQHRHDADGNCIGPGYLSVLDR